MLKYRCAWTCLCACTYTCFRIARLNRKDAPAPAHAPAHAYTHAHTHTLALAFASAFAIMSAFALACTFALRGSSGKVVLEHHEEKEELYELRYSSRFSRCGERRSPGSRRAYFSSKGVFRCKGLSTSRNPHSRSFRRNGGWRSRS